MRATSNSILMSDESLLTISDMEKRTSSFALSAEPIAANRWESAVSMMCSSSSFKVRMNAALSSERKWSGPPRNATWPRIGFPQASPLIVWLTTA